jgi:hypothetical protein
MDRDGKNMGSEQGRRKERVRRGKGEGEDEKERI